jgi:hypothetical protein
MIQHISYPSNPMNTQVIIEEIQFNTSESKLVLTYKDGTSKTYEDSVSYLADHPERPADVVAMGWTV